MTNAREQRPADPGRTGARSHIARTIGARGAPIAGALLLAGVLAAAATATVAARASGAGAHPRVRLSLGYTCTFEAGKQHVAARVPVTITASFPVAASVGHRVLPAGARVTVSLPQVAVAALRELGANAVSSTAILSVDARQRATTMTSWQGQAATDQSLPATGDLTIVVPARATPVTATHAGTITFTSADLTLALQLNGVTNASPSAASNGAGSGGSVSPSPTTTPSAATGPANPGPAGLHVGCTPASGRGARLAAVPVAGDSLRRSSPVRHPKPKLPKGCGHIKVIGSGVAVCGYIVGYSDVLKLYGAAPLQPRRPALPALVNIDFAYRHVFKPGRLIEYSSGDIDYQGHRELPPVRATFLAFRFVPVTATLMVTELTPIKIRSISGINGPPYPLSVRATTRVAIRISDVNVNGVPLAIGPHCRPVSSTLLTLTGRGDNTIPPRGYTLPTGGPLSGRLTIPAFTDCGLTENLDPLLTGSISGPGNYVLMTQGKLCGPSQPQNWTCPPPVPKPIH